MVLFFASTDYCLCLPSPDMNINVVINELQQAKNQPSDFITISKTRIQSANNECSKPPLDYRVSSCPWGYRCDYDPQRIPQYLHHAKCLPTVHNSRLVSYPVPVLRMVQPNSDPLHSTNTTWRWEMEVIPVGCICEVAQV